MQKIVIVVLLLLTLLLVGCSQYFGQTKGIQIGENEIDRYDVNDDGIVDDKDFFEFSSAFGSSKSEDLAKFDFNGDGRIDNDDFFLLSDLEIFGKKVRILLIPEAGVPLSPPSLCVYLWLYGYPHTEKHHLIFLWY